MHSQQTRTIAALIATSGAATLLLAGCSTAPRAQVQQPATVEPAPASTTPSRPEYASSSTANPIVPRSPFANLDPFARTSAGYEPRNAVFSPRLTPASLEPRSPQFAMFGDVPNSAAPKQDSSRPYDATENLRQISFGTEGEDFDPALSRDGKKMYFASTRHRPTADIYVKNVDGTAVTQLTTDPSHDVMPAISPDGQRIAFASNRNGSWDIYVMNIEGGQAVQVTSDTADELHPTWSPDGRTIAYSRLGETSDRWEIWLADLSKASSFKFLTFGLFPQWHPTDSKILFQRSRDRGDRFFAVWTIDYISGEAVNQTELLSSPIAAVINPTWSPDGEYIAVSTIFNPDRTAEGERPEFADIWIMKSDGSTRTNLTNGWFTNLMPVWGSDNKIVFVSNRNGFQNIWEIGPDQAMVAAGVFNSTPPVETAHVTTTEEQPASPHDEPAVEASETASMATVPTEEEEPAPEDH